MGAGFAASLAHPGGNVTGLSAINFELTQKRLELLRETAPRITEVAVLVDPADPTVVPYLREAEIGGRALGLGVQRVEVRGAADLDATFAGMARERTGLLVTGGWFFRHQAQIAELAIKNRLPVMGDSRNYAEAGALLGYGASYEDLARRAAVYVDKILKGAQPGDLPIERPTRFDLAINLKTAKALGLAVPQSLLVRADQVIQ